MKKINFRDNQEEVLNYIKTEIKDETICNHVYYAVEHYMNEANMYHLLNHIGKYGVWFKLKNGKLYHALFVSIVLFNSVPRIIVNTSGNTKKFKKLLVSPILEWIDEGVSWWIYKPIENEEQE